MSSAKIQTDSPVPLYAQLKEILRAEILNGGYLPHSRLPSEHELGSIFSVSRITIRQALGDLQKEGLIFKIHGKGTFVSQPKAFQNITSLQGFAEAMSQQGHQILNRVTGFKHMAAPDYVAQRLNIPIGAPLTEIRRIRMLDRVPVSMEITYLPEAVGKRLSNADLASRDIFLILENDCGIPLGKADLSIDATLADAHLATALNVDAGAAILRIERLTHDAQDNPIDFEYLYFRADVFQYRLQLDRHHAPRMDPET
ncbi:GntR family transcriptional regulator [Pollutimonas bauzanensis]|uniref:Transcriptional regulator, GntR family n=1 Tax=Pollutimonas bauzanensis TaxID=658167 RepID=A0A1M5Y8M4_9BURK|nr:GntR family transcriptional regulator [Pollutimonas bauzanensis]SHI08164.1 transcriptional regulator, GntR family [Pollutimonas bauzanensis]